MAEAAGKNNLPVALNSAARRMVVPAGGAARKIVGSNGRGLL
jgi:hypothetical protein